MTIAIPICPWIAPGISSAQKLEGRRLSILVAQTMAIREGNQNCISFLRRTKRNH